MLNCNEINNLISLYIDNELGNIQRRDFEEHIKSCESCKREVEEISKLVYACRELEEEELPEGFMEELHIKLAAVNEKENKEKKILNFPLSKMRLFSTIAASFIVVFVAAFLFKSIILTPSKMDNGNINMLSAEKSSAKSVEQDGGAVEKKKGETAENFNVAAADSNEEIIVQFSGSMDTMDETNANPEAAVKTGTGETGAAGESGKDMLAGKALVSADVRVPQKHTVVIGLYSSNINASEAGVEKLVQNYGGEKVVRNELLTRGLAVAATQKTENAMVVEYKIPDAKYIDFLNSIITTYGKSDVEANELKKQDLTSILDDLAKQSSELDAKIKKAESKEIELTEEEFASIREEKKIVDKQIEDIHSQLDFTFVTVSIKKR